jgi:hypothetical protein
MATLTPPAVALWAEGDAIRCDRDGVMLGTAWIDRPVDTQDLHSLLPRPP